MVARKYRTPVVVDTNVFVRNFLARGKRNANRRVIRLWFLERHLQLIVSPELVAEYLEIFDRILGMDRRGWHLDSPEDAGMRNAVVWGRHDVVLVDLDPGVAAWNVREYPQQRITGVRVERHGRNVTISDLEPAVVSEVLDGLEALTADGE